MIQGSVLDFAIGVTVASAGSASQQLSLGPTTPVALSQGNLVSATLLGDLATYTALPAVTGQYLMIPSPSGEVPN